MRRAGAILAVLLVAGAAPPARATDQHEYFSTKWIIEATPLPAREISVAPGSPVLKQRLLPLGLAVLDQDYVGAKPADRLAVGTELIRATGPAVPVYCAIRGKANLLSAVLSPLPSSTMRCFADDDADGDFDRTFSAATNVKELPQPMGDLPRDKAATIAVGYSVRSPETFGAGYYVGVLYDGQSMVGTLRRFRTVYGAEKKWGTPTGDNLFTKRDSDLPKAIEVLGAAFTVLGGDGKNVRIRIDRMMPAQPFGIFATVRYY